ncbi:MAG: SMP-30/gluconolactonase/LRE family protein [Janthinobacterium lividum]
MRLPRSLAALGAIGAAVLLAACAQNPTSATVTATAPTYPATGSATLQTVARFDHQVTGVTVSRDGRIFVNFPRWTEDSPVSVAEVLKDGSIRPFPDDRWNAWRNARKDELNPREHWVCVQSVVADRQGNVWALDAAAPAQALLVPMGAKLVRLDLATNRAAQTIAFDETIAPQGSYLNDIRFSPDGRYGYITDSGAKGALIVVDLSTGRSRRLLDGHPSTQVEKDVQVKADGKVLRQTDGRGVGFSADGIALSPDGATLYWQAIKGKTLYSLPTAVLTDTAITPQQLAARVVRVGENGVADGLLIGRDGRMYVTAPEDDAVKVRDTVAAPLRVLVRDARLRWPDTMAEGPDGAVYVTSSRIQDMTWFNPASPNALPTTLFRIEGR